MMGMNELSVSEKVGVHVDLPMPTHAADMRPQPEPVCPYCRRPDWMWMPEDLKRGRRDGTGFVQYHCYDAKCLD